MKNRNTNSLSKTAPEKETGNLFRILVLLLSSPILLFLVIFGLSRLPLQPDKELMQRYEALKSEYDHYVRNDSYGILINYELPIFMRRLWVIALKDGDIVVNARVSHARRSGWLLPSDFSNKPETYKSSRGCFVTGQSYKGEYGTGMRIKGLEQGVNDNAIERPLVFHPALGMDWSGGCFMTRKPVNKRIIELTKGGAFLYVHASEG